MDALGGKQLDNHLEDNVNQGKASQGIFSVFS